MSAHVEIRGAERVVFGSLVNVLPFLAAVAKSTAAPLDLSANPPPVALLPPPTSPAIAPVIEAEPMPEPVRQTGPDFEGAGIAAGGRIIEHADGRFRAERGGDNPASSDWHHTVRDAWQSFCRKAGVTFEPTEVRFAATVDCAAFAGAMVKACRVVEKRNTIPILSCVLLRYCPAGLEILATDMDARISVIVPGNIDRHFRAAIDAHLVKNLLKKCPDGQLSLSVVESSDKVGNVEATVIVKHERGMTSSMRGHDPDDFPIQSIGEEAFTASFMIPALRLAKAFGEVEHAISTEETRYYLNGVYLHTVKGVLTMVCTDGHRLAKHEIPEIPGLDMMPGIIIPRGAVDIVGFTIPNKPAKVRKGAAATVPAMVKIDVGEKVIRFACGDVVMVSKLVDGTFPDYARVIPTANDKTMRVNAAMLADIVDRLATMQSERGRAVNLDTGPDKVVVSISHPDTGTVTESVACDFDGGPFEIGFNSSYLLALLSRIKGEAIFKLGDAGGPAVIEGGDSLHVLMPMRV